MSENASQQALPRVTEPAQLVPILEQIFQTTLTRWTLVDSRYFGDYLAYGIGFDLPDSQHCRKWVQQAALVTGKEAWENPDRSRHWHYRNDEANFHIMLTAAGKQETMGFAMVTDLHLEYGRRVMQASAQPES